MVRGQQALTRTWRAKRHATCKLAHAACAGCVWQSRRTVTLSEISEMQVTVPHFHPGKRLGSRYQLESLVGTGQFGQVWRAKKLHPPSDMPVALKLPLDPQRGEAMLMADGQHMIDLPSHAGIVAVHWQGRVGSLSVVKMEFVNGSPLSHIMEDETQWSKVTFLDIMRWFQGVAQPWCFYTSTGLLTVTSNPITCCSMSKVGV